MFDDSTPDYIKSDYMHPETAVAGEGPKDSGRERPHISPVQQPQYAPPPSPTQPLPYYERADIAPYSYNYPYAGVMDEFKAKSTPFKTGLTTSAFILLGAATGLGIQKLVLEKISSVAESQGVKFAPVVGAVLANALRLGAASTIQGGVSDGLKATVGGSLPVIAPALITLGYTNKLSPRLVLGITGGAFLALPFLISKRK